MSEYPFLFDDEQDINFDTEQIERVLSLIEVVRMVFPEDLDFVIAVLKVLHEASGNEVGFTLFEKVVSGLESKYFYLN